MVWSDLHAPCIIFWFRGTTYIFYCVVHAIWMQRSVVGHGSRVAPTNSRTTASTTATKTADPVILNSTTGWNYYVLCMLAWFSILPNR